MFTVKAYDDQGGVRKTFECERYTVAEGEMRIEVTLYERGSDIPRVFFVAAPEERTPAQTYSRVIVENRTGKTTDVFRVDPDGRPIGF